MNERNDHEHHPVDEKRVDRDVEMVEQLSRLAWQRDLANVEALIERLRVEMIVKDYRGSQKRFHRAVIDRFEDVLEERYEKEDRDRETTRRSIMHYVRSLIGSLEP